MIHRAVVIVGVVLGFTTSLQAGVIVTMTSVPTVNLPNYTTYTLTASSDNGSQIVGFDFASQPTFGFFSSSMNQVNPVGQPTIFTDNNAFFPFIPGSDVSQDSQFKFNSSTVVVPSGFASESNIHLRAIFASSVGLGTTVAFAQIARPNVAGVFDFRGQIQTQLGSVIVDNFVAGGCLAPGCVPLPPQMADDIINNVNPNVPGLLAHTISASQIAALSNFQFDSYVPAPGFSGTGPATPATLNLSTRVFNWNTVGSHPGTYKWTMTAGNTAGFDNGSITVNVTVPEPTSAGLAFFACGVLPLIVAQRRRKDEAV
jgi:hypothetical protein